MRQIRRVWSLPLSSGETRYLIAEFTWDGSTVEADYKISPEFDLDQYEADGIPNKLSYMPEKPYLKPEDGKQFWDNLAFAWSGASFVEVETINLDDV